MTITAGGSMTVINLRPAVLVESERDAMIIRNAGFIPVLVHVGGGLDPKSCREAAWRVLAQGRVPDGDVVIAFDADLRGVRMGGVFASFLGRRARMLAFPAGVRGVDELAERYGIGRRERGRGSGEGGSMRPTTRRGGADPLLVELREADCLLAKAARIEGPARIRTSLQEARGAIELDEADVAHAERMMKLIASVANDEARRVLAFVVDTSGCSCIRTLRAVSEQARVPRSTAHRLLRLALDDVRRQLEHEEMRNAA